MQFQWHLQNANKNTTPFDTFIQNYFSFKSFNWRKKGVKDITTLKKSKIYVFLCSYFIIHERKILFSGICLLYRLWRVREKQDIKFGEKTTFSIALSGKYYLTTFKNWNQIILYLKIAIYVSNGQTFYLIYT